MKNPHIDLRPRAVVAGDNSTRKRKMQPFVKKAEKIISNAQNVNYCSIYKNFSKTAKTGKKREKKTKRKKKYKRSS